MTTSLSSNEDHSVQCIASTCKLNLLRGRRNHGREISVEEAHSKMHERSNYSGAQWQTGFECFVPASLEDRIGYHRLLDIREAGFKETLILRADNGHSIRATPEQLFRVADETAGADAQGFKRLVDLRPEDTLLVRNEQKRQGGRKPNRERRYVHSIPHHPYAFKNIVNGKNYKRTARARLVLEAQMNDMPVDRLIEVLRSEPDLAASLQYLDPALEVHHLDEDPLNDAPENLVAISKEEHLGLHANEKQKNFGDVLATNAKVIRVEAFRRERVYSVVMDDPFQNFVCHSFILQSFSNN